MKKVALVISMFALIFAFTVSTASAQSVTSADKTKTTAASTSKEAPGKSCCSSSAAKTTASSSDSKSGCAKSCSKSEGKSCCNKGEAKTETAPVPKKN